MKISRVVILYPTLRVDVFYNPTKDHSNILNSFRVMLRKPIVDARPTDARPTATHPPPSPRRVHHFNNQFSLGKPG